MPSMPTTKEIVKAAYPYKKWWAKVEKMTEDQIVAIYLKLKARGVIQ